MSDEANPVEPFLHLAGQIADMGCVVIAEASARVARIQILNQAIPDEGVRQRFIAEGNDLVETLMSEFFAGCDSRTIIRERP